jgi:AraC family transcriptional regulator
VLLVHATDESFQVDRVELVPHLHANDPLLRHIMLVLEAEIDAVDLAGRLYAEALTTALVVHLLRRYGTCQPPVGAGTGGLSKARLRRTTDYVNDCVKLPTWDD